MHAIREVSRTVRQVQREHHGGSQPSSSTVPILVGWSDIGKEQEVSGDTVEPNVDPNEGAERTCANPSPHAHDFS